ncbi:hypothetical protein BKA82DRAFT_1008146, partial [Pisolithus tinctorius]
MCDRSRLVCTLSFTGTKPTADELATLLYVTSAQEPKYSLHDTQCYWFAATVFDALKTLYKGPEQDPTPHLGGRGIEPQCRLKQEQKEQRQREQEAAKRAEEERRAAEERAQAAEEERQKECQATEEAAKWEREQRDPAEERAWAAEEANAKFS